MGRRGTQAKVAGPLLRRLQDLVMPLALKLFLHPEKESWLYDFQIDLNGDMAPMCVVCQEDKNLPFFEQQSGLQAKNRAS
jgi:hypothetical protein